MLSSSNVPQPEFACWCPRSPSAARRAAYSASDSPFISRCCQSMLTLTLVMPRVRSVWMTCSVIPMFRMRIFIAGSEFLCSRKSVMPRSAHRVATSPTPSTKRAQRVLVRRLEGVVVALDSRPEDHLRPHRSGEVGGAQRLGERRAAHGVVRRGEAAPCRRAGSGGFRSRSRRSRVRRAPPGPPRGCPRRAPAGSGTRSRP